MKIQNKLSLHFSWIFAVLLVIFSFGIYQTFNNYRTNSYFEVLRAKASLKFDLIIENTVEAKTLQTIYEKTPGLYDPMVAIYSADKKLIYNDDNDSTELLRHDSILKKVNVRQEFRVWDDIYQTIGFSNFFNDKMYFIIATGHDSYGEKRMSQLFLILGVGFFLSMLLVVFGGRFFAKQAFSPVSNMVEKVKQITANNLDMRVDEGNKKDELAKLAITFNQMLSKLEHSFEAQKQFVSNISHELRTPLSAIIAELELAGSADRTVEEYKKVIKETMIDAHKIVKLSDSLLNLAKANYDSSEIVFKEVRMDEVSLDACSQIKKLSPNYKVNVQFEQLDDDERKITIKGNEYLLGVAFLNVIENACKFSTDNRCDICFSNIEGRLMINFSDNGIGIPEEDLEHIFTPFFRGANKTFADGNGIGLPLTKRIIELHNGQLKVKSSANYTEFIFLLEHLPLV